MEHYYVNKNEQNNGDHEVHRASCSWIPDLGNREYLGLFSNCNDAVKKAREFFSHVNGCYHCSNACHTQ